MKPFQWIAVGACLIFTLSVSYIDWGGFKVVKEFYYNGVLKFIFQYIYYVFETGLFTLIIVFGQKAFEKMVWESEISIWRNRGCIDLGGGAYFDKRVALCGIINYP